MISKSRLEELIEQKAKIYSTNWHEEVDLSLPCEISEVEYGDKTITRLVVFEDEEHTPSYMLDGLTEDIEGAKWEEEFGCIERTERLELPTWEDFDGQKFVWFVDKNQNDCCLHYVHFANKIFINVAGDVITIGDLTKENYILACRKAKELFLGEKENV